MNNIKRKKENFLRNALIKLSKKPLLQKILCSRLVNYHEWSLLQFIKRESKKIKRNSKVLDAGAGELKYKEYFKHCNYVTQDLGVVEEWDYSSIDIKSSIYEIPVEKNSFDYIVCTQVLEHLDNPRLAFKEFNRILKKNGKIILSAPLCEGEHELPFDYFRFTQFGLKELGEKNGFKIVSIEPHGGIFINIEFMMWEALLKFFPRKNPVAGYVVRFTILFPLKILSGVIFNILDILDREKECTLNYNVVYKKI
jgi:SAM-dependent methyltransferase